VKDDGTIKIIPVTEPMIVKSLSAVAETVFPFRALFVQKQWMRRGMRKPRHLSFRKMAAAVGRMSNNLPLFPKGSESDRFSTAEQVELLEWSIPQAWRTKFDLEGYVPTSHSRERLIKECEAIERNESTYENKKKPVGKAISHKKSRSAKYKANEPNRKSGTSMSKLFYCSEHGNNPTHATDKCFTIKNRAENAKGHTAHLTKKSFKREINVLAKKRDKKKVLEMFANVLKAETAKLPKSKFVRKKTKKILASESDSSDDDESVNMIDVTSDVASDTEDVSTDGESFMKDVPDDESSTDEKIKNLGKVKKD